MLKVLFKNRRVSNFISLFSGSLFSHAVNFLFYVFLSRTYREEDFGVFALFTSYVTLTSVVTNPQVPILSLSSTDDEKMIGVERWSESVLLYSTLFNLALFSLFYIYGSSHLGYYMLAVPFASFLYTLTENRKIFYNRREEFLRSNLITIIPRTGGNAAKLLLSRMNLSFNGLIIGEMIGNLYTLTEKIPRIWNSPKELATKFRENKDFFVFNYPSTLAGVASTELIPFFLISLYSVETAGAYFLFEKFFLQPFLLTGSVIGNSQAKYISSLNPTSKRVFFFKLFTIVIMVSFPAILILLFQGGAILEMISSKQLFTSDILKTLVLFIPVRLVKGIIYIFHHSSLTWQWGFITRSVQVILLIMGYCLCRFFDYSFETFLLILLFIEVLGEVVVIYKALSRSVEGSLMKYLVKKIISSSGILKVLFIKFENTRASLFNENTSKIIELSKHGNHENVFNFIYDRRYWFSKESVSGSGSDLETTSNLRQKLEEFVSKFKIEVFLDVPCGDFHWMKEVNLSGIKYIGGEIVQPLVQKLNEEYSSPDRSFHQLDLVSGHLPVADVLMVRDCFIHLENKLVLKALDNIAHSDILYLLVTHSPKISFNMNIHTGEFREINLCKPPFNLPPPIELINEGCSDPLQKDKSLGLWKVADLLNREL